MRDDTPASRVLIVCADRRLSRGLALYAADMGLDPMWQAPDSLPGDGSDIPTLTEACGAALLWVDADDCPLVADGLPPGTPAVLWSRAEVPGGLTDTPPFRIRRPIDTVLLEKASRLCLDAAADRPLPASPVPPQSVSSDRRADGLPALTPLEARMYAYFVSHRGEPVTRETLKSLLHMPVQGGSNMVDVYVGRLRKKLERPGERLITAVRGKGYRML